MLHQKPPVLILPYGLIVSAVLSNLALSKLFVDKVYGFYREISPVYGSLAKAFMGCPLANNNLIQKGEGNVHWLKCFV